MKSEDFYETKEIKIEGGTASFDRRRSPGREHYGCVEAVPRTPRRSGTINKCSREAYVPPRIVLEGSSTTRLG